MAIKGIENGAQSELALPQPCSVYEKPAIIGLRGTKHFVMKIGVRDKVGDSSEMKFTLIALKQCEYVHAVVIRPAQRVSREDQAFAFPCFSEHRRLAKQRIMQLGKRALQFATNSYIERCISRR